MAIKRIVANIETADPASLSAFYSNLFGLETAMDFGWIVTLAGQEQSHQPIQISVASQGGSGTPVPELSIEVDDFEDVLVRATKLGIEIEYGPVDEPWSVRRFYIRDPAGKLINVLTHQFDAKLHES